MADIKTKYGSELSFTMATLNAPLGAGSTAQSVFIDSAASSNFFLDVHVRGNIVTHNSLAPVLDSTVVWYVYGSNDGTTFSGSATGTDANFAGMIEQVFFLGQITVDTTTGKQYRGGPWSVAAAFGGYIPRYWGVLARNNTGQALHTSAGNTATYLGITMQTV